MINVKSKKFGYDSSVLDNTGRVIKDKLHEQKNLKAELLRRSTLNVRNLVVIVDNYLDFAVIDILVDLVHKEKDTIAKKV